MSGPPVLTLSRAIPGDTIITVEWELSNYTGYRPVAMKFYINDVNATPYVYGSSLKWSEVTVPVSLIKNNMFDIPNLLNGTAYVFYGFIILQSTTNASTFINVNSKVSSDSTVFGSTEIMPFEKPLELYLDDGKTAIPVRFPMSSNTNLTNYSGADPTSTTEYNLKVVLNKYFTNNNASINTYVPDSVVVMTKDNNSNPADSETREFPPILWQTILDGKETDSFGNIYYVFRMTDLEPNLTYEVSAFAIKNNTIGPLSNTILAVATQRASPPQAPRFLIEPTPGNVKITTTITERGATSDIYYINLYKRTGAGTLGSPYVYTQIVRGTTTKTINNVATQINYTFDLSAKFSDTNEMTKMVFPYDFGFNTVTDDLTNEFDPFDSNNLDFPYGVQQTICFTVYNKFGENPRETGNFATFTPYKKVSPPSLSIGSANNSIRSGAIDLSITALPALYGQTIAKYVFYNKVYDSNNIVTGFSLKEELVSASEQLYTLGMLDKGTRYSFAVKAAILNTNYTGELNTEDLGPQYIESDLSIDNVNATMYAAPGQPTVLISYLEEDVNSQAKLTWTAPTDTSNLTIVNYKIYRRLSGSDGYGTPVTVDSLPLTYTDTTVTNGTAYDYIVSAVTSTADSNSTTSTTVEGATSVRQSIVPWSMPAVATLLITDNGNHWVQMTVTDNVVAANGLSTYFSQFRVTNSVPDSYTAAETFTTTSRTSETQSNTFYYTGLVNDVVNTFKPYVVYTNPNVSYATITTGEPSLYTETPAFEDIDKFEPSSIVLSSIGSNTVTVGFTEPTFVTNGAGSVPDNVSLNGYKVAIYLASDTTFSVVKYLSSLLSTTTRTITDSRLINGNTYVARVIAYYDDSTTSGTVEQLEKYSEKSINFIPITNPNVVTNIVYSDLGTSGKVTISYTAPTYTQGSGADANNNIPVYKYLLSYQQYELDGTTAVGVSSLVEEITDLSYSFTGLNNGKKHKFFVTTRIQNPNPSSTPVVYDSIEATNTTMAVPFNSDTNSGLYDVSGFDISSISGTSIGISWTSNSSLFGLPFNYKLEKSSDSGENWSTLSTIASTATTSYTDSDVTVGTLYQYRISIIMSNPNGGTDLTGPLSNVIDAKPYLNPDAPTGLTPAAGDSSVGLTWTTDTVVNGLPVQGYNLYQVTGASPYTYTKLNTDLVTVGTFSHTSLTNGILYKYAVTTVTQNTNDDSADLTSGQNIESGYSSLASATPYKAPDATVATIDITDATSRTNTINWSAVTNTGGFPIAGYNLYQVVSGTPTKLNTDLLLELSYSHTGLTNGSSYSYIVRAVVLNTNAGNVQVESADSNTVTKIPFTRANAAILSYNENNETDIDLNWSFTDNTTNVGRLTGDKYFNINVTNNSQPELSYVVSNVLITLRTNNLHITPGNSYSFAIETVFKNPNDNTQDVKTVSSALPVTTFGFADVHLDLVQTDLTSIKIAMNQFNDIDLKGGYFRNYYGFVYELKADNTYVSPNPVKTFISNDQISYQTITGLTEYKRYKIVVQVETGRVSSPNDIHRGDNTYLMAQTIPPATNTNRPQVLGVTGSSGSLNVQSSISEIKYVIVAITEDTSTNSNKQLFYYIADPTVGVNNMINIQLSNITYAQIKEVNAFVYNTTNGLSNVFSQTNL